MVAFALLPFLSLLRLRKTQLQALKYIMLSESIYALWRPILLVICIALFLLYSRTGLQGAGTMSLNLVSTTIVLVLSSLSFSHYLPSTVKKASFCYQLREWGGVSLPLLFISGLNIVFKQVDVVLVGLIVGPTQTGLYAVATRLTQLITFGLTSTNTISAPMIAELFAKRKTHDLQRVVTMAAWMTTTSSVFIALTLVLGRATILKLFGGEYQEGGDALIIMAIGQIVNACTGPVGLLLNMTGYQNKNAKILAVIAVFYLAVSYPAIHYYGLIGAAIMTSLLMAAKNLLTWLVVLKNVGVNSSIFTSPKFVRLFSGTAD
jgi:O-antigen/teichoic acid export membrane protein